MGEDNVKVTDGLVREVKATNPTFLSVVFRGNYFKLFPAYHYCTVAIM